MLEVGSAVQFGDPVQYGIIKKIERDPVSHKEIAEVEMVSRLATFTYVRTRYVCIYKNTTHIVIMCIHITDPSWHKRWQLRLVDYCLFHLILYSFKKMLLHNDPWISQAP